VTVLIGHITGFFPCPSVHHVWTRNLEIKKHTETKTGLNVPQGRSNQCANFEFKESRIKETAAPYVVIGLTY